MDFDEEWFISDKEDALNALDKKEVEVKALENGEDEEQVDQGSGIIYFNHHFRRLKPIAIVNKDTITIASLIQPVELHQGLGDTNSGWVDGILLARALVSETRFRQT